MTVMEKIERYTEGTPIANGNQYYMTMDELQAFWEMEKKGDLYRALCRAFEFGRAKGYRAEKAEAKRHG